jgi:hypothetical protein
MRYFSLLIFLAWLAGCTNNRARVLPPSSEEYEIYSAVIDSVYNARNSIVIDDSTGILEDSLLDHSSPDLGRGTSLRDDFARKDSVRWALSAGSFNVNKNLLMLDSKKHEFSAARGKIGWTEFRKKWDGLFVVFSRVGFNPKHDQAILHIWNVWIPQHGYEGRSEGWWITVERSRGQWIIKNMSTSFPT